MYQPHREIIRSSQRDFVPKSPDMDNAGWQHISDNYLRLQEKKYQETNDLYDLQNQELNSLNEGLQNLSGQDQIYYQESILAERDNLKNIFKGKNTREFKSPEVQAEIYAAKSRLANKLNSINTFHEQANAVVKGGLKDSPSTMTGEVTKYLNDQMQLPPDKRDKDLITKIKSDPLFYNAYDDVASFIKSRKTASVEVQKETKDLILNYDAKYIPDLETFDPKTQSFKFNPSDELVDQILFTDPYKRMYNKMVGMLPPEQAKSLIDSGNDGALRDAVRQQTKEYLKTVKGFEADLVQKGKTVKSWNYYKPSAADKKDKNQELETEAIQQRLLNSDIRAFDDYLGTHWKRFQYEFDDEGKPIAIIAEYEGDHPSRKGKKVMKKQYIEVDPNDKGSVAQAINIVKRFNYTDKDQIFAKPMEPKEPAKKGKGRFDIPKK